MRGIKMRDRDLLHHERRHRVNDVLPVAHVVVERSRRDAQIARQPVHRQRRESLTPGNVERLAHDEFTAQDRTRIPRRPAPPPPRRLRFRTHPLILGADIGLRRLNTRLLI